VSTIWPPDWVPSPAGFALDPTYSYYAETGEIDEPLRLRIIHQIEPSGTDPAAFGRSGQIRITVDDLATNLAARAGTAEAKGDTDEARRIMLRLAELYLDWGAYDGFEAAILAAETFTEPGSYAEALNHRRRATAYSHQGDLAAAEAEMEEVIRLADDPAFHYHLGKVYLQQGKVEEGIAELEAAAGHWDPSIPHRLEWFLFWQDLGSAYEQVGRIDEAIGAYRQAQFVAENLFAYLDLTRALGPLYRRQGDPQREVACYARAVNVIAGMENPGQAMGQLLENLAVLAAESYSAQGLDDQAALHDHGSAVDGSTQVGQHYLQLFTSALERQ
jgi:tetratricopeptide (TPR) repeat protein